MPDVRRRGSRWWSGSRSTRRTRSTTRPPNRSLTVVPVFSRPRSPRSAARRSTTGTLPTIAGPVRQKRDTVSADTQELERSALERKDRDELQTIAIALGGKPGSRAKKADIVDLILELAGPTPAPAPTTGAAATDGADPAATSPRTRRSRGRAAAPADVVD